MYHKAGLYLIKNWVDSLLWDPREPTVIRALQHVILEPGGKEQDAIQAQEALRSIKETWNIEPSLGFLYIMQGGGYHKLGRSIHPSLRLSQISPVMPFPLEVTHIARAFNAGKAEQYFHALFSEKRTRGEWFRLNTEDIQTLESRYGFYAVNRNSLNKLVSLWENLTKGWTRDE